MSEKTYKIISIVLLTIVLLGGASYFLTGYFNNYVTDKQIEAQEAAILTLVQIVAQEGFVSITIENQTMILVPVNPESLQQPQN